MVFAVLRLTPWARQLRELVRLVFCVIFLNVLGLVVKGAVK
jgi:hypothetical protein